MVCNMFKHRQDDSFNDYLTTYRSLIFKDVHVLIYVFDAVSAELDKDIHYYQSCLESILTHSPDAIVFCLMHKMDLIQEDKRDKVDRFTCEFCETLFSAVTDSTICRCLRSRSLSCK